MVITYTFCNNIKPPFGVRSFFQYIFSNRPTTLPEIGRVLFLFCRRNQQNKSIMKAKSTSLFDIEKIVNASEGSKLSSKFITENTPTLERLSKKLGVSKAQTTLFAIIASSSYNDDCSLSDIKRHLGCENLDMLRLSPDSYPDRSKALS